MQHGVSERSSSQASNQPSFDWARPPTGAEGVSSVSYAPFQDDSDEAVSSARPQATPSIAAAALAARVASHAEEQAAREEAQRKLLHPGAQRQKKDRRKTPLKRPSQALALKRPASALARDAEGPAAVMRRPSGAASAERANQRADVGLLPLAEAQPQARATKSFAGAFGPKNPLLRSAWTAANESWHQWKLESGTTFPNPQSHLSSQRDIWKAVKERLKAAQVLGNQSASPSSPAAADTWAAIAFEAAKQWCDERA